MSQIQSQQGYEEIDLIELMIKIYKFFKKRYKLILISSAVFVVFGFAASSLLILPRYQSSMIISSRSLSGSEISGLILTLDELVKEDNTDELTRLTKIPKKEVESIITIKSIPNRDYQKNVEKDLRRDSTTAITVEITDNKSWQKIQTGIVEYLENVPYVQKKTKIYKENQERILMQIQKEIKSIDSLKRIIESSLNAKNSIILSNSGGLYNEALKLYEAEKKVKESLFFLNDIIVIKEFAHLQKPKKFSIKETILIFGGIGFVLSLLVSLIIELNKMIRKRENTL